MSRPGVLSLQVIARTTALVAILLGFMPFSGATALAVAGGDFPDGLTFGGMQRSYLVHVPPALEQPTGLVINLHGAGMTAAAQVDHEAGWLLECWRDVHQIAALHSPPNVSPCGKVAAGNRHRGARHLTAQKTPAGWLPVPSSARLPRTQYPSVAG